MKKFFLIALIIVGCFVFAQSAFAQIPTSVLVQIVRAEDERRYDTTLENLMKDANAKIRVRAALAAGRIGDERAIPPLTNLLKDDSVEVQTMAMFALGETESAKASEAVLEFLKLPGNDSPRARAVEAAGKIALANPKDANTPKLSEAIISTLNQEFSRSRLPNSEVISLGETAVLRARPAGGEELMIRLLSQPNPRIRADALNTLARLRSKKVNVQARELLQKDSDPVVRANAARMLGVSEDKTAIDLLLNTATKDPDSRVRVSAIRALGSLKDASVADALLEAAKRLLGNYNKSKSSEPSEKNELLEIATTLGKILTNTNDIKVRDFLIEFYDSVRNNDSPEISIALVQVAPNFYSTYVLDRFKARIYKKWNFNWHEISTLAQTVNEVAKFKDDNNFAELKQRSLQTIEEFTPKGNSKKNYYSKAITQSIPDVLRAYAAFKSNDLSGVLRRNLINEDVIVRATVTELLGGQLTNKENVEALKSAFTKSLLTDKHENDAQLAMLDALYKLDKKSSVGIFLTALNAPDYLVRKKAFEILADAELQKDFPGINSSLENARMQKKNQVLPFAAYTGTKLGQILNSQADYTRAVSRKNGTVKAVLTTTKGNFTIDFYPEDAPLTVDNFIKLARANYFNGVSVHRVVPNFVMQDGDPRGDGNGGPGWQIRCEINMLPFERGWVGMALSGKDTGGSQWFATHSPQPHLNGGYTVFGRVNETDMKIVDSIVRGDKILSVRIIEANQRRKPAR